MGIISLERIDNLIWLGRYSERIYLTIKEFFFYYDKMLDDPNLYKEYCYILQILMIYENDRNFVVDYVDKKFNALNDATLSIKLDTESKTVIICLLYTRDVFVLNKDLQKGLSFNINYMTVNESECTNESIFTGTIIISDLSFNLSTKDGHKPTVTLYCTYN